MMMKLGFKRKITQIAMAVGINSYIPGFIQGRVYQGGAKHICVPGLNCYSCPGALGSCPIGAFQTTLAGINSYISAYVTGFLAFIAVASGRFTCGWLCPFGMIQELLYRIPFVKKLKPSQTVGVPSRHTPLRHLKYLMLLVFVILLPALIRDGVGLGETWFCAYVCPAGTVEAALPLLISNEGLRELIGWNFLLKALIASFIIIYSMAENRPFCKYMCPLGAVYGLGNKISVIRLSVDRDTCISCGVCSAVCGMDLEPVSDLSSIECIRCGACREVCPVSAISWQFSIAPAAPVTDRSTV
jgi:ferredoxin-like protein FixX